MNDPAQMIVSLRIRAYLSTSHIQSAALMARRAQELEAQGSDDRNQVVYEHRATVIAAIWSAVGCLEAAINEVFADASEGNQTRLAGIDEVTTKLWGRTWRGILGKRSSFSVLEKYGCALELADRPAFDPGCRPLQDVTDLVKLRNALIHYVPETLIAGRDPDPQDQHQFEKLFTRRFAINPLTGKGNPFYPDKLLGHGCAAWATASTLSFLDDFFHRIGLDPPYHHVRNALATTK